MAETLIWLLICCVGVSAQRMDLINNNTKICKGDLYREIADLRSLEGCVVVLGSLEIFIERADKDDFVNMTFRDLREITDYLVIYRVRGLESVGQLFPHLTRIRGTKLLNNFGLVVYDNADLKEIGLYSLMKIDRGGVTMWALPQACFLDKIDWEVLAPKSRHVIGPPEGQVQCNIRCTCSINPSFNRCWNNKKCQLYLTGPEADTCNEQCIGCRKTNKDACFVCRHFTYKGKCVSQCPPDSILLHENQYCITEEQCFGLGRWVWNKTCVSECPTDFKKNNESFPTFCEPCTHCEITCKNLRIQSLSSIQNAEKCVYVNGSLVIHIRAIPGAMGDLRAYLGQIQEVAHYVAIVGSDITSLDFLPSLRVIKGEKLKDDKYSLDINHNYNLQSLFTSNVTKNLRIVHGTARFEYNPVLCMNKIDEIKNLVPVPPGNIDIPEGSNGIRGACKEVSFEFQIIVSNESSVRIKFSPVVDHKIHYTALYVRLPPGVHTVEVPETCSEFEWLTADVPTTFDQDYGVVELIELQPASIYALCIEIYDPDKQRLIRSNIFNFKTSVGIPKPPFFVELVASLTDLVVLNWVDHKDYVLHIHHYELDVALIEMNSRESAVDYCRYSKDFFDVDDSRHALVRRPPPEYSRGCESMCGILSSVTPGAMAEDYFDVFDDINFSCDNQESIILNNSSYGNYVRTLVLNISGPRTSFQVGGLAPFSDYRFRLRACTRDHCSRSARGVVKTNHLKNADIPYITYAHANQFGHIFVNWDPPNITNGPVLAYTVEVLPKINYYDVIPQVWCVLADKTRIFVQSVMMPIYSVRVCAKTLAPTYIRSTSCSDWKKITAVTESKMIMLWVGVLFGILIYIASCIVGWIKRRYRHRSDVVPLVDSSSSSRVESEPPAMPLSDFVPFHTIPLDLD